MKIVVAVRTRNEEINIERFCQSYQWVDKILVADGGSKDNTVELALKFPNVEVKDYPIYMELDNGIKRTPHGSHLNFLIDWTFIEEKADWIIMDDCDCFPNKFLREHGRNLLESADKNFVYVTRLYLWKNEGHFPALAKPNESPEYVPSLWAWKNGTGFRFRADRIDKIESHQEFVYIPTEDSILNLYPPYALLHNPWQTDEMVQRKLDFYRFSGQIKNMLHPLQFGGEIEPLPEWAKD